MPSFSCRLSDASTPLPHVWEHTVGSCHATLALRADWQRQLERCSRELGMRHVRFHGLLSDDMGTMLCEMDKPLYSFFNADEIMDFLLSIGMKPFVELSFMPLTLSSGGTTVFHYAGNVTPPKDNAEWAGLVSRLVTHWVDRYGLKEVRSWFFEVWNEPNLKAFWTGTQAQYFDFYLATAQAIKAVDSEIRVGGPATANDEWIPEFLAFCHAHALPPDFVSTHHYPTDSLGSIGEDTETQLSQSTRSFLRDRAQRSHDQSLGIPLYYTEWNSSSNPRDHLHDEPYAAAVIVKTMMEARGLVQGYSYWTFSDIFEENFMPDTEFQGGFGLLTLHGVAKPSYRAFELLHRIGVAGLQVEGSHDTVDVWMIGGEAGLTVLILNHALPRHAIATESVQIRLTDCPAPKDVYVERIDDDHANARRIWEEMGSPKLPSRRQVEHMNAASLLRRETQPWTHAESTLDLTVSVPPQGIAAVTIGCAMPAHAG